MPLAMATHFALLMGLLPPAAHAAEPGAPLIGRWMVSKLQDERPSTPAGDITFDAKSQTISGASACNFFQGGFESAGSGDLTLHVGMMTRRGCSGAAAEHERALLDAMTAVRRYRLAGDRLILTRADGSILAELTRAQDVQLEGPQHKIVSYFKDGGLYSADAQTKPALQFKQGTIEGNTGCGHFTARYTRDGDRLVITQLAPAPTRPPCGDDIRDQDTAILAALPRVTTFDTNRNLIRLLEQPDGAAMLWITPAGE